MIMNQFVEPRPSVTIHPKILYYGTPVILLTTLNEDMTVNISPISSSWALGNHIILGLGTGGKALENLKRMPECVINLPAASQWEQVEGLARLTGKNPVPAEKKEAGFIYEKDKFAYSGLTQAASITVQTARIAECPIQIEARVNHIRIPEDSPHFAIVETQSTQVHVHKELAASEHHIHPASWKPLIYNFRHYFGLSPELGKSYRSET
ncbi:Flavin reductase like domain protein [compost metagenome]